MKVIPP